METTTEIIHPDELGAFLTETPEATEEPLFFGFECLGCGGRHADLVELIDCQMRLQALYALRQVHTLQAIAA